MKRKWLSVMAALLALLAVSCAGGSKRPEPDKVVGALLKCTMPPKTRYEDPYVVPAQELSADRCQQLLDAAATNGYTVEEVVGHFNIRYVVTVRTAAGSGYSLEVPATRPVWVGEVWPPTP